MLEKYEMAGRKLYIVISNFEKAFTVSREVILWALRRKNVMKEKPLPLWKCSKY